MRSPAKERGWLIQILADGSLSAPPELYFDQNSAEREAQKWAGFLSRSTARMANKVSATDWQVGGSRIAISQVSIALAVERPWIGTYWTDGQPDPLVVVLADREEAVEWTLSSIAGIEPHEQALSDLSLIASFRIGGRSERAEAHPVKICR